MHRAIRVCVVVGLAGLALPGRGVAQDAQPAQALTVDPALAKRGESLYRNRGCEACHTIGKGKRAGPDLQGVTQRRDLDWLRRWLKNTNEMLESDSTAKAMLAEYNGVRMPGQRLSDADVDALIHYIAREQQK
jgi:cytochrome c551/c552